MNTLIIPEDIISIDEGAFGGCGKIKTLILPETLSESGTWWQPILLNGLYDFDMSSIILSEKYHIFKELREVATEYDIYRFYNSLIRICRNKKKDINFPMYYSIWREIEEADLECIIYRFYNRLVQVCKKANDEELKALIRCANKWSSGYRLLFYTASMYSDVRSAMVLAKKRNALPQYAALRGMNEDEVRKRF